MARLNRESHVFSFARWHLQSCSGVLPLSVPPLLQLQQQQTTRHVPFSHQPTRERAQMLAPRD